jgi:hypothetical protein
MWTCAYRSVSPLPHIANLEYCTSRTAPAPPTINSSNCFPCLRNACSSLLLYNKDANDRLKLRDACACAGDSMQVIRDALLSQLQKDRLRQEIIVAELARIETAMALHAFCRRPRIRCWTGGSAVGPERHVGVGTVNNDLTKEDGVSRCGVRENDQGTSCHG